MDIKIFYEKYIALIERRYNVYHELYPEYTDSWYVFTELQKEVIEVQDELKDNNKIYLEDELWDILWDYMVLLQLLQKEWKINSLESVFKRSFQKFSERISAKEQGILRDDIKKEQKKKLADEHNKMYII